MGGSNYEERVRSGLTAGQKAARTRRQRRGAGARRTVRRGGRRRRG